MISYKLYDSAGYLVDSGNIYLSSLSAGDKFKDDSVVIYDILPANPTHSSYQSIAGELS